MKALSDIVMALCLLGIGVMCWGILVFSLRKMAVGALLMVSAFLLAVGCAFLNRFA